MCVFANLNVSDQYFAYKNINCKKKILNILQKSYDENCKSYIVHQF